MVVKGVVAVCEKKCQTNYANDVMDLFDVGVPLLRNRSLHPTFMHHSLTSISSYFFLFDYTLQAGADAVDVAMDAMAGTTSQPSMGALASSLARSPLDTGLDMDEITKVQIIARLRFSAVTNIACPKVKSSSCILT